MANLLPHKHDVILVAKPWRGGLAQYLFNGLQELGLGNVQWWPSYPVRPSERLTYLRDQRAWRRDLVERINRETNATVICLNPLAEFAKLNAHPRLLAWLTDDPRHAKHILAPYSRLYISDPGYAADMAGAYAAQYAGVIPFAYCRSTHTSSGVSVGQGGLCMIGNADPKRTTHLQALANGASMPTVYGNYFLRHPLFWRYPLRFHRPIDNAAMGATYARHQASLNIHAQVVRGGTNMRTFECAAYGIPQLVEYRDGLEDLLTPASDIATYRDEHDIVGAAARLTADRAQATAMAVSAQKRVVGAHSYTHRAAQLLRDLAPRAALGDWL